MDDFQGKGEEPMGKREKDQHDAIIFPLGPSLLAFPLPFVHTSTLPYVHTSPDSPKNRLEALMVVVEEAAQGATRLDEFAFAAVASAVGVVDIRQDGHH